jgi:putative transposase
VLDARVQSVRDRLAAERLLRKLIRKHARVPQVLVTDKLGSYGAALKDMGMKSQHRQHKGLNNGAETSHQPTRRREQVIKRFKSARHLQRFISIYDPIANLFHFPRHSLTSPEYIMRRAEAPHQQRCMTTRSDVPLLRPHLRKLTMPAEGGNIFTCCAPVSMFH